MKAIPKSYWRMFPEKNEEESVFEVTKGDFQGMEIAVDWTQGWVRAATKKERLLSIITDRSLVEAHQRIFLEERHLPPPLRTC